MVGGHTEFHLGKSKLSVAMFRKKSQGLRADILKGPAVLRTDSDPGSKDDRTVALVLYHL